MKKNPQEKTTKKAGHSFGKDARLLKKRDFQFRPFRRYSGDLFLFIYTTQGKGRLGVSISKKVLKKAAARNRVRRLLREVFRHERTTLMNLDLHVIGKATLTTAWESLSLVDIREEFARLRERIG